MKTQTKSLLDISAWVFRGALCKKPSFVDPFLLFGLRICLCYTVLSVPCSIVITRWEGADLLALLYVMFSCVLVTFPYDK